jgi:hypothetical protein
VLQALGSIPSTEGKKKKKTTFWECGSTKFKPSIKKKKETKRKTDTQDVLFLECRTVSKRS